MTLENAVIKNNFNPLSFRYAVLSVHYRKPMEWSSEALENAERSYKHLRNQVSNLGLKEGGIDKDFKEKFLEVINNDLNIPRALAIVQELLKSALSNEEKLA
ncbi:MAG: cysteine--tRNA ligase, partial [Patescibacteria group bacterium]